MTTYWHPKGESVLVVRADLRELSSLLPDPKSEDLGIECETGCAFMRHDYGRTQLQVSIHPFVAKPSTKLLKPLPPKKPTAALGAQGSLPGKAVAMSPHSPRQMSERPKKKKRSSGCGCAAATPRSYGATALLLLLTLLILPWLRARSVGKHQPEED